MLPARSMSELADLFLAIDNKTRYHLPKNYLGPGPGLKYFNALYDVKPHQITIFVGQSS